MENTLSVSTYIFDHILRIISHFFTTCSPGTFFQKEIHSYCYVSLCLVHSFNTHTSPDFMPLKDPGRSKYNHTSMESLVDVEYKYIRVNIVFPFHKLQDAERTSHCPPPPSYVTYLVRLAETLMTSFRVGVARDVRPLELLWLARARRVNGFCTQSQ